MIDFIGKRWHFISVSLLVIVGSLLAMWHIGFNKGIDFVGGIKLTVKIDQRATDGEVADALSTTHLDAAVQQLGRPEDGRFSIKFRQPEGEVASLVQATTAALDAAFGAEKSRIEAQEAVGPRVGKELYRKGQAAILFTLIALLIYIGFRFDFYFAPGAIVALFHDVIITMGFLVVAQREFDLTIVAALLTIVGFSLNDTIVIYDRIREHRREITEDNIETIVNKAINDTLSRTIITSLTVLFVVLILFFTTQGVIQNFAYAFIIGVIAGSYSTIFIASPVYIWLYRRFPQWRKA